MSLYSSLTKRRSLSSMIFGIRHFL